MKKALCLFLTVLLLALSLPVVPGMADTQSPAPAAGDVTGDGAVNASDALAVLKVAVKKLTLTAEAASAADVDCSDRINSSDALQILKYAVKKIRTFEPIGLNGRTLLLGTCYAGKYNYDTEVGRTLMTQILFFEMTYGVDVRIEEIYDGDPVTPYDLVELPNHRCRALAKTGALKDLTRNAMVDLPALAGACTDSCTMGTQVFGGGPRALASNPMGLLLNTDLLKKYAPVSYGKLAGQVASNTWDFDALDAMMAEYSKNRMTPWFIISNTNIIGQAIVANAGYEVDFVNGGKGAVSSIASPEGIAAMKYLKKLKTSGAWAYSADILNMYAQFSAGHVPALVYYIGEGLAAKGNFNVTAVPFPHGPSQSTCIMSTFNCPCFAIPDYIPNYGNGGAALLNALAGMDEELAEAQVADMADRGLDALGQQTVAWAAKHTTADFSTGPFDGKVGGPVDGSVLDDTKDPAIALPAIADLIQQQVDACYGRFYVK